MKKPTPAPDRKTAVDRQKLRARIAKERQRRIQQHKKAIVQEMGGAKAQARAATAGHGPLNILAEGDSWFDYPFASDIIDRLISTGRPSPLILSLAHHGDATTEMLGIEQRKRIIKNLGDRQNGKFDALLFSGGGNDIAGDQFVLWLAPFFANANPSDGINQQRLANIVGVIKAAYVDLIAIRDEVQPDCILFLHAYDFAQPSGKGVCGLGPWLKPSLDFRGWTNFADAVEIVREILLSLDQLLTQLESETVVYVRTQGTISPASDWSNELHPKQSGFNRLADVFLAALRAKFPNRV